MMRLRRLVSLAALAAGLFHLNACASIEPARMATPMALDGTTTIVPITGIGGGQRGSYSVAGHSGTFKRSESRLVFFDVLDNRSGSTRYTLTGPFIDGQIEADCTMREKNITISVVSFTPKKMAYSCYYTTNGRAFPARFELQEVREGLGGALMKRERRGEIALDRVILQIQSVHKLQGSAFETASPIGYVFSMDGVPVGAVEVNGTPRVFLPVTDDPAVKRAVIAGALALGLFWDPANSALDD